MQLAARLRDIAIDAAVAVGMNTIPALPERPFVRLVERLMGEFPYPEGQDFMVRLLELGKRALKEASPNCRRKMARNFYGNALIKGARKRDAVASEIGVRPPFLFVVSPTMRCNLACKGCYAFEYRKEHDLPPEVFDRLMREAKELGIYFITISGGEPFVYEALLELFREHDDMFFQVYTNGTLIDEKMAGRLAELGNVLPAISVEGFRRETDQRRGPGVFDKILRAMASLKEAGVLFGFSATATRQNNELIVSDEFVDFYVEQGCFLGWYFNYVPIGRQPNLELMPTPQQRYYRRQRLLELRKTKPILLADFWNDGSLTGGCIAGGRSYFHVNSNGDLEPCVFCHFAVDNVKEKSLVEALQSPFFQAIRRRQPYSDNHLRPCMLIDNPKVLREVLAETGARPTHPGAESLAGELAEGLDRYAEEYAAVVDPIWEKEYLPRILAWQSRFTRH